MSGSNYQGQGPRHSALERVAGMNLDGSSDRGSVSGSPSRGSHHSRSGSTAGSQAGEGSRSRSGSTSGGPGKQQSPFPPGLGHDPARMGGRDGREQLSDEVIIGKKIDLPAEAFKKDNDSFTQYARRPGFSTDGKSIKVQVNIFPVKQWPTGDIVQYDVNVSPNPNDSRALVRKVWESAPVQSWLKKSGAKWLFDGHKLAWAPTKIPRGEERFAVDLDRLAGKEPRPGKNGVYYIQIRQATQIRMQVLQDYLQRKCDWDKSVLQCMNFLDHLLRQYPSENMIAIKRNFYNRQDNPMRLDTYTDVRKGTYSAFRLGEMSNLSSGSGLGVNVDVANTAFWNTMGTLAETARAMLSDPRATNEKQQIPWPKMAEILRPVKSNDKNGNVIWQQSEPFQKLRRLAKLKITVNHRGKDQSDKVYTIKRIVFEQSMANWGADAQHYTFQRKRKDGKLDPPITIHNYFMQKYKARLQFPDLPLIETMRDGIYPMEACRLQPFQRYTYKLDPEQTSKMIKFAVTRPVQRSTAINNCMKGLHWESDPYFKQYNLQISNQMIITPARLLQNPEVHFGGSKLNPGTTGRWDLRGRKFLEANPHPIQSWAFIGVGSNDGYAIQEDALKNFAQTFKRAYSQHGGVIKKDPFVKVYPFNVPYPQMCEMAYKETGMFFKATPQVIFFVVGTRNSLVYERIKKNMDCRFCTVSQVMLADHVRKANLQYCGSVAMKVNAKLGGVTCRAAPVGVQSPMPYYTQPTMIIGLDVSHGAPGSGKASMAAMTVSTDKNATRYAASVQTNGYRTEIVGGINMRYLFGRLLKYWINTNKCHPKHVYFFRDGVAEGQFGQVIDTEIKELKRIFRDAGCEIPRVTVMIATKRHHVRFFPNPNDKTSADKNANALPGTLVEHDATHPFHWDFYLSSHSAIQGTARPVHYQVIMDEAKCNPNDLQRMLYHHCYQYARSTTPVSLHPAVYYSHLASVRAASHEDIAASQKELPSGKAGFPLAKAPSTVYGSGGPNREAPPLLAMENPIVDKANIAHINTTMWYV
ncbi:Protein argonaute [Apiospora arundinis]